MKDDRGDNDLEVVIDKLTKQKEFLQFQCRKAGTTIEGYKMLIEEQKKEIWQLKLIASENGFLYCGVFKYPKLMGYIVLSPIAIEYSNHSHISMELLLMFLLFIIDHLLSPHQCMFLFTKLQINT